MQTMRLALVSARPWKMALIRLIEYVHSDNRNARRERDNHEEGSSCARHATVVEDGLLLIIRQLHATASCQSRPENNG